MSELSVTPALLELAAPRRAASAGSAAALVGAIAASVAAKVARIDGSEGEAAQALALSARLTRLADADADAFGAAREALVAVGEGGDERRDFKLGKVLARAAAAPASVAEACADVAVLARALADSVDEEHRPDARSSVWLAAAAAESAAHLVEINLAVGAGSETSERARLDAERARMAAASL